MRTRAGRTCSNVAEADVTRANLSHADLRGTGRSEADPSNSLYCLAAIVDSSGALGLRARL